MKARAFRPGTAIVESGRMRLNRGELRLSGGATRDGGVELGARLDGVHYLLDHGVATLLDGDLALRWRPGEPGRLSGEIVVDRGSLRRDLALDRELLRQLFGAPELESTDAGFVDDLRLDLFVSTREGVSVRNNLADLHVDWSLLRVRGTLGQPLVRGRIDVDPGGRVTAYGQTVRIDEGALILSGDPDVEPRLLLETRSSLEDPTLRQDERWYADSGWGDRGSWETGFFGPGESVAGEALGAGVTDHYTDRLASAVGGALGGTEVSYQPLAIFGDSDTQARWTLTQRLSPHVTFVNSRNPRKAEGTTNLVDLHGFATAPGVAAQLFNNDDGKPGATLQQTLQLGGRRAQGEVRLRRLAVEAPRGPRSRQLRLAAGYRTGDLFPEGSDFEVEVAVAEWLRRRGYPGNRVRARVEPAGRDLVDVRVTVDPGPAVRVVFAGDAPPRSARGGIAALYQPARRAETAALEEMRRETVKALRAQGFLEPRVEPEVVPDDPASPSGGRTVRVGARGGRRAEVSRVELAGLDEALAAEIAAVFDNRLERVELAAATEAADAFLLQALRRQGYPDAEVLSRALSADGRELAVTVRPGTRRSVREVVLRGVGPGEAERLRELADLAPQTPVTAGAIAGSVNALESDLHGRGHVDARVDVEIEPATDGGAGETLVIFTVEPGPSYRVAETRLEGLAVSREDWAESVAAVQPGAVVTAVTIAEARRRLYETRVFQRIGASMEPLPAPPAGGAAILDTALVFDLDERPRYSFSYGGRWESGEELGGAVYLSDQNFLGRGRTLGLRAIYMDRENRSAGLYHAWPDVAGSGRLLEFFLEALTEIDSGITVDGVEGWTQLTIPLSPQRKTRFYVLFQDRAFTERTETAAGVGEEEATNLFLGWQYLFDSRDRALGVRVEKGGFLGLDLSATTKSLGSDFGEVRLFAQGKLFRPVGHERPRARAAGPASWAQSLRIGWLEPFEGVVPRVDRLEAGGEYSVRGYRTDTLGPLDAEGNPLGGEVMIILNEELHLPLWRDLRGVLFFDAGNVWASTSEIDGELFTSAGIGLRSPSPIGPLRLDLALPLDRREGIDPEYKVYFGFGPTF